MKTSEITIEQRSIGSSATAFVIAEVGINHDGDVNQAHKLVDAAADCGADAVKFQTFRADKLLIPARDRLTQQGEGSESAFEMFRRVELGWEDFESLRKHARERGISFLSTPFDEESADFLDRIGVPAFKIASSDLTHVPLLKHVAGKGKPIFLSTGMAYLNEVADALWTLKSAGAKDILLMHCVSLYPAPAESLNLRAIQTLSQQFDLPVGYSDHSQGIILSLAAIVLGAAAVEKHFTLDKSGPGPDHKLSADPEELRSLIRGVREVELALGDGRKRPSPEEAQNRLLNRRSVVSVVDIRAHETVAPWMLACKRPGGGIEPREFDRVVGMRARRNIGRDSILNWNDLAPAISSEKGEQEAATTEKSDSESLSIIQASKFHA
jgi:N-acetylneuraminate synthase/N,N'-diacetyllegionaminate synthase